MAGVIHDYECPTHGVFEARAPKKCPFKGCEEEITRVFLKAPSYKSDRTKNADKNLKQLGMEFNMTNIKSTREGENQEGYFSTKKSVPVPEDRPGSGVMWGNAGRFNLSTGLNGGFARSVAGEAVGVNPKSVGNLTGPKTASYMKDPDNLQLKK